MHISDPETQILQQSIDLKLGGLVGEANVSTTWDCIHFDLRVIGKMLSSMKGYREDL